MWAGKEQVEPRPAIAEADTADAERDQQDVRRKKRVEIEKSNVLMMRVASIYTPTGELTISGPTGTGKTLMTKTLARILDVPFV
jgi:ATP-dependent Clp protease ATP-binding subunit ClpX